MSDGLADPARRDGIASMPGAEGRPVAVPAWSIRRVTAMVRRYTYLLLSSWPRILELAYWPTVQMLMWGFMTMFLAENSSYIGQAFGVLISGVLLWDILFRGQIGLAISFMEEMWSRNLGHLFVSPLRPLELVAALVTMSLIRTLIGVVPASILAIFFFGFSIYDLGLPLVGFFLSLLIFAWAIGLAVSGLVLLWGQGAESLAWAAIFGIMPFSAVYYPVTALPDWIAWVAWLMPAAYSFEGMRTILLDGTVRLDLMAIGYGLNLVYLALGTFAFLRCFRIARRDGLLLQQGE
ncbi:ABC transporter permease [Marinibaculum pumilum]|uniref:Transport permease protein n=1 Tax=Marinibaculum pumilum TaxID=1766165 RepID=A0ABV7L8B9_9PROT